MSQLSDADIATASQWALRFQLIDHSAIRRWGDELVLSRTPVPIWAIDLAECHFDDVDERLRRVPGVSDKTLWQRLLDGLVAVRWKQGRLTIDALTRMGWTLYAEDDYPQGTSHWGLKLGLIDEYCYEGYSPQEKLTEEAESVIRLLEPYVAEVPAWMAV